MGDFSLHIFARMTQAPGRRRMLAQGPGACIQPAAHVALWLRLCVSCLNCAVTERLLQRGMRAALASRCRQSCTRQLKRQGSRRGAVCQHPAVARAGGRQSCTRACSWNRSSPRRPAARLQLREALAEAQAAGRGRRRHCARRQRQHSGRPGLCPCAAHELRVGHISPRQALRHLHGNIRLPRLRQLGLIMDCSDSHMDCPGTRTQGPPRPARAPAWYK